MTTTAVVPAGADDHASGVVVPWLVRLRWGALVALIVAGWAAIVFWRVRLPLLPLVGLLMAMAATNAALTFQLRSPAPRRPVIGGVLILDIALLTGVLYLAGGPLNPFSIVYLVGITIGAVVLGHRWAVVLAVLSNLAYGTTFAWNQPIVFADPAVANRVLALHLYGMWVALAAAAGLIAHFVSRISEALARRERELTASRAAAARTERMAALFALGAGAAHELATPLSTIRTITLELERMIDAGAHDPTMSQYVAVMRGEVERCTHVLDGLSGRAASTAAGELEVRMPALFEDVKRRLGDTLASRIDVTWRGEPRPCVVPPEALSQVLVALLRNAFDASASDQRVSVCVEQAPKLRVEVIDQGRGMAPEDSARAGEPFFTTKAPGSGLGLGLFLARAFADQLGGTLRWTSALGKGTSVILELPV